MYLRTTNPPWKTGQLNVENCSAIRAVRSRFESTEADSRFPRHCSTLGRPPANGFPTLVSDRLKVANVLIIMGFRKKP